VANSRAGKQTVRNLVLSLAVACAGAAVMYWLFVPHDTDKDPVKEISYAQELVQARRAAPYPVAAPEGLGKGWRATSVTYQGTGDHGVTWHLGFVTADEEYVAVEQGSKKPAAFIDTVTQQAEKTGRERVAGQEWERYEGSEYDALVRTEAGVTTVVTGRAPMSRLTEMAAALKAENA
jgi:hypothetical protein